MPDEFKIDGADVLSVTLDDVEVDSITLDATEFWKLGTRFDLDFVFGKGIGDGAGWEDGDGGLSPTSFDGVSIDRIEWNASLSLARIIWATTPPSNMRWFRTVDPSTGQMFELDTNDWVDGQATHEKVWEDLSSSITDLFPQAGDENAVFYMVNDL